MLDNEENRKDLDEIGSIITNKINQPPSCSQDGFPDTVKRYTGKGSRFYFTLQLKSVESDLLHEMTPDLSMDFTGKGVFVVEDNALNMEIACMLLDTFGIEVKEVYNGKEAVEDVRTTLPGYYDAENGWTGGNANDQTARQGGLQNTSGQCQSVKGDTCVNIGLIFQSIG